MNKVLIILGSTSTGKTDLGLMLAKKFNGELVSCDSRQVYQGLDLGTGKLPSGEWKGQLKKGQGFWEINGVKIGLYDVADPKEQYTVYRFVKDANKIVADILRRKKLPIIVGGSGLYLKAVLEGLPNLAIPVDAKLRKRLEKLSLQQLQEKLQKLSPDKWDSLNGSDRQNPRRLARAIELVSSPNINAKTMNLMLPADTLKIGLTASRQVLYQRIDERVVSRINQGMIEEAEKLHKAGLSYKRMRQLGLEYGVLADYLEVKTSRQELIKVLQGKIHGYARRQTTWFKKEKGVFWFDIEDKDYMKVIENLLIKWYDCEIEGSNGQIGR